MLGQINATQMMGLASIGGAALACGWAAWRRPAVRRSAGGAAIVLAMLAIEVVAGLRHRLDAIIVGALPAGDYALRRPWQAALILVLVIVGTVTILRVARSGSAIIAAVAALVLLFMVETISLHAIDGLFYRPVGPVLAIAWLWLALSGAVVIAALRPRRGDGG